jgi:hypothetical protein
MTSFFKFQSIGKLMRGGMVALSTVMLVACGGGGGSPGVTVGGNKAGIVVDLIDCTGKSANTLTLSCSLTARATVVDSTGQPQGNVVVAFSVAGDGTVLTPSSGTALTNSAGVATISLSIANLATALSQVGAAGSITASATIGTTKVTGVQAYKLGANNAGIAVDLIDCNGQSADTLTLSCSLTARATVRNSTGQPQGNAIVNFSLSGDTTVLTPSSGVVLTNSAGVATITLSIKDLATALSQVGTAVSLTVSATTGTDVLTGVKPFNIGASSAGTKAAISLELIDTTGTRTNTVTLSNPVAARATVVGSTGLPAANTLVSFATGGSIATLAPTTALTDANGVATVSLSAKDISTLGADVLTASATVGTQALIATKNYSIGLTAITLRLVSPNSGTVNIKAYDSTSIQVDVLSNGVLSTAQQSTVNFSSACAPGKADLPASATTINGRAQVVYRDKGCSTTDIVTISAAGAKSITATIVVAPPAAASIGFVSATPSDKAIVIKGAGGTGRTETAVLTFLALDTAGQPLANQLVNFAVNSTETVTLQATSAITGADGKVVVSVNSGTKPTTFRVIASLANVVPAVSTVSDTITVTTGQPVQAAFSLSAVSSNIEGWLYDNIQTKINILLADQFGNPVADGTPIVFQADSGAVGSSSIGGCTTTNGGCSVDYRSQNPRFGMGNASGKRAGLGTISVSSTSALVTLAGQIGVFLSGSFAENVYLTDGTRVNSNRMNAFSTNSCGVFALGLELNDLNNNPMPAGTTVEAINSNLVTVLEIIPKTVLNVSPHSSSGNGTLIPGSMATRQGSVHTVPVKTSDKCVSGSTGYTETGTFDVKITTPIGNASAYSFSLTYPIASPALTCVLPAVLVGGSCVIPPAPKLILSLSSNVVDSTHSPNVSATVTDANGTPQANIVVTFTVSDAALVKLSPSSGTALTNANGVATIQLAKVVPGSLGAASVTASATVNKVVVTDTAAFSVGASSSPVPVAINFTSAVPADKSIVIKGSGGSGRTEVALLTFSVVDNTNTGVGNVRVNFSLVTNPGIATALPSFGGSTTTTGVTDGSGAITVSLNSGTDPTTVRVVATLAAYPAISALSDTVTVTTGQPTQLSFSMSLQKYYVEGWNIDNNSNNVLVLLADQFGGAVADGTQVVFTTTTGAIVGVGGAKCLTGQTGDGPGACHVTWRSQNPRPAGGVGSITATATASGTPLSITQNFYNSGSSGIVYQVTGAAGATVRSVPAGTFTLGSFANCNPQTIRIEIVDGQLFPIVNPLVDGNPMPEGTKLAAFNATNASAVVFPDTVARNGLPIPNATQRGSVHAMTITPVGCALPPAPPAVDARVDKTGYFDFGITAPSGTTTYWRINLGAFKG